MQNKLNFGIVMVFSLALLGLSACAPAVATKADKGSAKAKKKVAAQNAFSCSMSGMQTTCVAVSPTPVKPKKGNLLIAGSGFNKRSTDCRGSTNSPGGRTGSKAIAERSCWCDSSRPGWAASWPLQR